MKKLFFLLVAAVVLQATYAGASNMVTFNGSDIMADSTGFNSDTTPVIGDGNVQFSDGTQQIATYDRDDSNQSYTDFNAWLDGLGAGEGISEFSLWLQNGNSDQARMWGEDIALTDAYSDDISAFASSGWTAEVWTIDGRWGDKWEGRKQIIYRADSSDNYLRPGSTATFGFTADIFGWDETNGWDVTNDPTGSERQIWVGADLPGTLSDVGGIVSDDGADMFQRAISVNSAPVPEPATMLLFGVGLLGIAGVSRRRKA